MTVYELLPDSHRYHDFALVNSRDQTVFPTFDGRSLEPNWTPLAIAAADEDDELAQLGDYALLGTIPVVSEAAVIRLGNVLSDNGQLLPLKYDRGRYFALNVTKFVGALDEKNSDLTRLATGRIMSIERFAFHDDQVSGETIFKIPQLPRAFVFVTTDFVNAVNDAGLSGFQFRRLWSSDNG